MFARTILFVFCTAFAYAISASANDSTNVWSINGSTVDTLTLIDNKSTVGEELIMLNLNDVVKAIKVEDVSIETYGGTYYAADVDGNPLEDLSVEAIFKSRYAQILLLLQDENFRSAFTFVPESCPSEANGFLIINDNLTGDMTGYCLVPR